MSPARPLTVSRMFHITGIFPLCILLTCGADKKRSRASRRTAFPQSAHSDRMSESRNITRGPIHTAPAEHGEAVQRRANHSSSSARKHSRPSDELPSTPTVSKLHRISVLFSDYHSNDIKYHFFNKMFCLEVGFKIPSNSIYK